MEKRKGFPGKWDHFAVTGRRSGVGEVKGDGTAFQAEGPVQRRLRAWRLWGAERQPVSGSRVGEKEGEGHRWRGGRSLRALQATVTLS